MTVIFQSAYALPGSDQPLTHARVAHAGNWLAGGTVAASSTASDFFADAPANSLTYEKWKPDIVAATWEYDHGSAAECDYCVIGAHTMGTNGNTLQVQYWDGAAWADLCPATPVTSNAEIYVMFAPQTRQRWRLSITNGTAPEIGVAKFGKAMQLERPIAGSHEPMEYAREVTTRSNGTVTGEFAGMTKVRVNLRGSFQWGYLSNAWVQANWPNFQRAVETEPFFISWRPGVYQEAVLCYANSVPRTSFTGSRNFMSASVDVTGYSND